MSTTSTTTRPEVAHDVATADAYSRVRSALEAGLAAAGTIHRIAGDKQDRRTGRWGLTMEEALLAADLVACDRTWERRPLDAATAAHTAATEARKAASADADELNKGYTGWSRFFLVTSSDGHIHSSMACSTCYPTTVYAWLPELSGLTAEAAVAEHGEILCSVCFPDAPVAWTTGESRAKVAEREARAAAKAERAAAALAKALLPTGEPLRVTGDRLKTLAAAKTWLTDSFSWNRSYPRPATDGSTLLSHPSYPAADVAAVAEAVAAKTGDTPEAVLAAAEKRAAKRDGV